jgi:hypothetical protein
MALRGFGPAVVLGQQARLRASDRGQIRLRRYPTERPPSCALGGHACGQFEPPALLAVAGAPAQSPDHDQPAAHAKLLGIRRWSETIDSPRGLMRDARGRSAICRVTVRLRLAWQVQQYHPGRATDRVLPSTRNTPAAACSSRKSGTSSDRNLSWPAAVGLAAIPPFDGLPARCQFCGRLLRSLVSMPCNVKTRLYGRPPIFTYSIFGRLPEPGRRPPFPPT